MEADLTGEEINFPLPVFYLYKNKDTQKTR